MRSRLFQYCTFTLRSCRVSDALISLHWLRVPESIWSNFQGCRTRIQGPPRLCTVVPWPVYLRCRPSKSPRTSLFLQRLPRPASGSPFHYLQPSIFGCWPSGTSALDSIRFCLLNNILTFGRSAISVSAQCTLFIVDLSVF